MRFRTILALVALALAVVPVSRVAAQKTDNERSASQARAETPEADRRDVAPEKGHLELSRDPFIRIPRDGRAISPGVSWSRDEYVSIQVNVDADGNNIVGDAANEPSIAVDPTNPSWMAIGWRQFDTIASDFRQGGWGYSRAGGRSWTFPGVIEPGEFSSDPVLEFDSAGNFYFYSLQSDRGPGVWACYLYKSSDGGESWPQEVYAWGGDKEWMTVDRSGGVGDGNVYGVWSSYFTCCDGQFTRSTDGGLSFLSPIWVPRDPMWGVLTVGPEGAVYVAGYDFWSSSHVVARSSDAQYPGTPTFDFGVTVNFGGSWHDHTGPNPGGLLGQVWVACDHSAGPTSGNVYMLCSVNPPGSDPLDVMFTRSTNGGQSWSSPVRINDVQAGWQWFGTLSVAPNGRIDAIWNDTRNDPGGYDSELYYSYSEDAGVSWSANVAVSPAFDPHVGWPQQNKIGDYYDMISDRVGVHVAYAATFNGEQDVYYLRIGDYDCNDNGVGDSEDIAGGTSEDCNGNGIPDECDIASGASQDADGDGIPDECGGDLGDLNCDGVIDGFDIEPFVLALTSGPSYDDYYAVYPDCDHMLADCNSDGAVNGFDIDPFVELLAGG